MTWCCAIDPSKRRSGWCLINTATKPWLIKSGSFGSFEGSEWEIYTTAFMSLGRLLKHTIPKGDADRVFVIERPMYQIATKTVKNDGFGTHEVAAGNPKTQCVLHGITSAFITAATLMKFRPQDDGTTMPATWRRAFFGKGFKTGNWKKAAKDTLAQMKIHADNHDEAEAIAICWVLASQVARFK